MSAQKFRQLLLKKKEKLGSQFCTYRCKVFILRRKLHDNKQKIQAFLQVFYFTKLWKRETKIRSELIAGNCFEERFEPTTFGTDHRCSKD